MAKTNNILVYRGRGAHRAIRDVVDGRKALTETTGKIGRYLGPLVDAHGDAMVEVKSRAAQATQSWPKVSRNVWKAELLR